MWAHLSTVGCDGQDKLDRGFRVLFSPQVMHCTSGFFPVRSLDGRGVSELLSAAIRTRFPIATDGRDDWGLLIQC